MDRDGSLKEDKPVRVAREPYGIRRVVALEHPAALFAHDRGALLSSGASASRFCLALRADVTGGTRAAGAASLTPALTVPVDQAPWNCSYRNSRNSVPGRSARALGRTMSFWL